MSDTAPRPAPSHPTDPYAALRAMLRTGKNDEAIVRLCALTVMRPDDLIARELLFDAFFQKRDYPPAFALIKQLADGQPDNARFQRQLIVTLNNMKRYDEAIPLAAKLSSSTAKISPFSTCSRSPTSIPGTPLRRSAMASAASNCATWKPAGCPAI
ncbi:MAG: hypothetical protein WA851_13990 [Xanthobacteraceae bacterium]